MPRVQTIQTSRVEHICNKCRRTIPKGEGYRHWAFRYGGKRTRCLTCPLPRPSELTQSDKLSRLYETQEMISDVTSSDNASIDSVREAVESARDTAQEVLDEYQEALDAWENGNEQLQEKVDECETYFDVLDNAVSDIESTERADYVADEDEEIGMSVVGERHLEAVIEIANDAAGELSL